MILRRLKCHPKHCSSERGGLHLRVKPPPGVHTVKDREREEKKTLDCSVFSWDMRGVKNPLGQGLSTACFDVSRTSGVVMCPIRVGHAGWGYKA